MTIKNTLRNSLKLDPRASDSTAQYLHQHISNIDSSYKNLKEDISQIIRKNHSINIRSDILVNHLSLYAEKETAGVRACCNSVASGIKEAKDARDTYITHMETYVYNMLKSYQTLCNTAKDQVKARDQCHYRENRRRKSLGQLQMDAAERNKIQKAKQNLRSATTEVRDKMRATVANENLLQEMEKFERRKIKDVRNLMGEFLRSQIEYHARCLQIYSDRFESLNNIDENEDILEMLTALRRSKEDRTRDINAVTDNVSASGAVSSFVGSRNNSIRSRGSLQFSDYDDDDDDDYNHVN